MLQITLGNDKKEFGDYQTPPAFCDVVCKYLINNGFAEQPQIILEPTCGKGHFITAALKHFKGARAYGVDCNPSHAAQAKASNPEAQILTANIFSVDVSDLCGKERNNALIIGNPPWALNSELSNNLPTKRNFKGLRGIDALTGSSNFDICEYIILKMLEEYKKSNSIICMLCKNSVARNVVLEISRNSIATKKIELVNFNSSKIFNISAAACILIIKLSPEAYTETNYIVKDIDAPEVAEKYKVVDGLIKPQGEEVPDFEGVCPIKWRQGVKHDCGKVMELTKNQDGEYINKYGEVLNIEEGLIFPLVKSSHFKSPIITDFKKYVIVTQKKAKEDTSYIKEAFPLTWQYLNNHKADFDKRKSVIYNNAGSFAMFGIGDYSYKKYKVGLSGFYKKPLFCLLHSEKAVMTDDTAYFITFESYNLAYAATLLLNSEQVQKFLLSIAFIDNKRPYTVKLLARLDLKKCVEAVTLEELQSTEKALKLPQKITENIYNELIEYIKGLQP